MPRASDDAGEVETLADAARASDPAWLKEAFACLGMREARGAVSNPEVVRMFAESAHPEVRNSRTTPWCAAFIGATLARAGLPNTGQLTARSYLKYGKPAPDPVRGDIAIMWRGKKNDGFTGHIFYFLRREGANIIGLGGNQGDAVTVAAFPASKMLGYVRPRSAVESKTIVGAVVAGAGGAAATGSAVSDISAAAKVVADVQAPMQDMAGATAAFPWGKWFLLAAALLTVAGALLSIYGRLDIRRMFGR